MFLSRLSTAIRHALCFWVVVRKVVVVFVHPPAMVAPCLRWGVACYPDALMLSRGMQMSKLTLSLAAVFVLLLAGCSSAGDEVVASVSPTVEAVAEPAIEPTEEPEAEPIVLTYENGEFPGTGTFVINVDIGPGTYGSDDGMSGASCRWQLQNEAGEALRDGTDANGVLILKGQYRFVTEACPVWVKLD
jgi:hypothetical protein